MSQALYRKWRPHVWEEVIAQEPIITTLRNAIRSGHINHAYLLAGPRGTGKTTTARLLAKALNCLDEDPANRPCDRCEHCLSINAGRFLDLIEIDAASNTSVDDVRALRDKINFSPTQGRYKVYIIDEVHMLSTAAFNALLKTLEEPPAHAVFVLATTEVHKIPATVLSRVQRHEFRRIPVRDIVTYLKRKTEEEGLEVDEEALQLIARQATGAFRDAISLLDQLTSTGGRVTLARAQEVLGTATGAMVTHLIDALVAHDAAAGLRMVQNALDAGTDPRQFARQVVDYLRSVMMVKLDNGELVDATPDQRAVMSAHALAFENDRLIEVIRLFNTAAVDAGASWHPGLAMELAVAEASAEQRAAVISPASSAGTAQAQPEVHTEARAEPPPASGRTAAHLPPRADSRPSQPAHGSITPRAAAQRAAPSVPIAQPQTPPAEGAEGGKGISAADLGKNWERVKAVIKKKSVMTEGLLNSCRPSLKENTLYLGFSTDVLKSKMETVENLDILRQAIQTILGVNLSIRCVVAGSRSSAQPDGLDPDGLVGTALDLGAKIIQED